MHINMYWATMFLQLWNIPLELIKSLNGPYIPMPFLLVWCLLTEKRNPLIKLGFIEQCTHLCILMLC
jgi:hypothetical protein